MCRRLTAGGCAVTQAGRYGASNQGMFVSGCRSSLTVASRRSELGVQPAGAGKRASLRRSAALLRGMIASADDAASKAANVANWQRCADGIQPASSGATWRGHVSSEHFGRECNRRQSVGQPCGAGGWDLGLVV